MKNKGGKKYGKLKKVLMLAVLVIVVIAAGVLAVNGHMCRTARDYILTPDEAADGDYDCILVLGAGVWHGDEPSPMLADRLDRGLELYFAAAAPKLLMSGDHGTTDYNEVQVMKNYALERGVESEDIFMDHAGFSTYESMYRARDVFCAKNVLIVTQRYHMYRAVYIARELGLDAYGVCAEDISYSGQTYRECREILARAKDFVKTIIKPEPTFLGEAIPVQGDGNLTND